MAEGWEVKAIREAEELTLAEFSLITGIRLDELIRIELCGYESLGYSTLYKVIRVPRFAKYVF